MGSLPSSDSSSRAESLFAEWATAVERGESVGLEELIRSHPDLEPELKALHEDWRLFAPILAKAVPGMMSGSSGELLVEDDDEFEDDSFSADALLERLALHLPAGDRYCFRARIGQGAGGVVLRVWDSKLKRSLAMKLVLGPGERLPSAETAPMDPRTLTRFVDEARIASQLSHPGIVPIHDLGSDQSGRAFFTMKLVEGRSLQEIYDMVFVDSDGWNETRALSVIMKICEAMSYAHTKGIIHRDLKPANVMVGDFGEVYVMDWGLARAHAKGSGVTGSNEDGAARGSKVQTERAERREEDPDNPWLTKDGDIVGTPSYMPPEQARGSLDKLSPRSDVYAIGAMLYHLLARRMPYVPLDQNITSKEIVEMVANGPPAPLSMSRPDLPPELLAIVDKAMSREVENRYEDTVALAADLRAFLEGRVVSAYQTGMWPETRKWISRNKPLAGALLGVVVALCVGTIVALYLERAKARSAQQASELASDVLAISAIPDLARLVERADNLWPVHPSEIPEMDRWIADANKLLEGSSAGPQSEYRPGLKEQEARLARLDAFLASRHESSATQQVEPSTFSSFTQGQPLSVLSEQQVLWWRDLLGRYIADVKSFSDPATGLYSSGISPEHGWGILKRVEKARTMAVESLVSPDAKQLWTDAASEIEKDPMYSHLKLLPQMGLLPVGRDPDSSLWEFCDLLTGTKPSRDSKGHLILSPEMGIIFVLLPGGEFTMGSSAADDSLTMARETPAHAVRISPFFVSKFEVTQAQWQRMTGSLPSRYNQHYYKKDWNQQGQPWSPLQPVEQVTWDQCFEVLSRFGLQLPSEAQWEYSARGNTKTAWWTGDKETSLSGSENLLDEFAVTHGAPDLKGLEVKMNDGYCVPACVGSFRANRFGLHDMAGNVAEWCQDAYLPDYTNPPSSPDPVAESTVIGDRVYRGGDANNNSRSARSAHRDGAPRTERSALLGVRAAREIESVPGEVLPRKRAAGATTPVKLAAWFTATAGMFAGRSPAQTIELISLSTQGSVGNAVSDDATTSSDGRYVAFGSGATNLIQGDTNGVVDVFLRDRVTNATTRLSVTGAGVQGNAGSGVPRISASGNAVAFHSGASNLVPNDTNSVSDVFVADGTHGTIERVSIGTNGQQGNGQSLYSSLSADGRFVAFYSEATNLVAGDTNNAGDVFVRDRVLMTTELVSVSTSGSQGSSELGRFALSADGRFVAFTSRATNLVAGDNNNKLDVFLRDRLQGTTERISVSTSGLEGTDDSVSPSLSGDARFVAFASKAPDLVAGDTNNSEDVFVRDRLLGTTERVSLSVWGTQASGNSLQASISADGRYVAFQSDAPDLVADDTNSKLDIFVRDRLLQTTWLASRMSGGIGGNGDSHDPRIGADGEVVSFWSEASNLVVGDSNSAPDSFVSVGFPKWAAFCFGDGTGSPCPCSNQGVPADLGGCRNSLGTGGKLDAAGTPSVTNDTLSLQGSHLPNAAALYFQGTSRVNAGAGSAFGDGLRCAGGTAVRIATKLNSGGSSHYPESGDQGIAGAGGCSPGELRTYQCWYRNAASFCTPATFNLTNGIVVLWEP